MNLFRYTIEMIKFDTSSQFLRVYGDETRKETVCSEFSIFDLDTLTRNLHPYSRIVNARYFKGRRRCIISSLTNIELYSIQIYLLD